MKPVTLWDIVGEVEPPTVVRLKKKRRRTKAEIIRDATIKCKRCKLQWIDSRLID